MGLPRPVVIAAAAAVASLLLAVPFRATAAESDSGDPDVVSVPIELSAPEHAHTCTAQGATRASNGRNFNFYVYGDGSTVQIAQREALARCQNCRIIRCD